MKSPEALISGFNIEQIKREKKRHSKKLYLQQVALNIVKERRNQRTGDFS